MILSTGVSRLVGVPPGLALALPASLALEVLQTSTSLAGASEARALLLLARRIGREADDVEPAEHGGPTVTLPRLPARTGTNDSQLGSEAAIQRIW